MSIKLNIIFVLNKFFCIVIIYGRGDDMNINADAIERGIKYTKIIIVLVIVILILFFGYRFITTSTNTEKFYDYLDKNYTKHEDGSYEKRKNTDDGEVIYRVLNDEYLFSKEINSYNNYTSSNLLLYLSKDGSLTSEFNYSGANAKNGYGTMLLYGTYNIDSKKFECKTVLNDGFESKCDYLKKESVSFYKEINKILKENNIDYKHVKKN